MSDLAKKIDLQAKKRVLSVGKRFRSDEEASEVEISKPYVKLPSIEAIETALETRIKYYVSTGNCMMEVFRVIVNTEGHISGKIFIDNGRDKDIYKAEEDEYVSKGGDLLLPGAVLLTYDCFLIFADLNLNLNHKTTKSCRSNRFNEGSYSEESRRLTNCDVCFDEGIFNESKDC